MLIRRTFQIIAENGSLFRGDGEAESRSTARRLLVKLSETCGILPSSLNISGVKDCETEAVGAGGFADIYRASYNGEYVALKRLREYESDTRQNARRVSRNHRKDACRGGLLFH